MGYHIKLYSANKEEYQNFDFDMERFKKSEDDYEYWDKFNAEFDKVFKYEFEIGDFIKFDILEKIESSYGEMLCRINTEEEFLDIIKQYNTFEFEYSSSLLESIEKKMMNTLELAEDRILMVRLRDYFQSKAWQYNKWTNNLRIKKDDERLTNGWRFETDMIELLRIYKSVDFDKTALICVGS